MPDSESLRVAGIGERWRIEGGWRPAGRQLCNDYLSYLADRRYSPASVRAYAFDLLHFARWLDRKGIGLDAVDTDALLRYLAACRAEPRPGQHDNVISLASGRASGFAPATINRRLSALPAAVIIFVLAWFIKEVPLRGRAPAAEAPSQQAELVS
jgi:hypothetical protein